MITASLVYNSAMTYIIKISNSLNNSSNYRYSGWTLQHYFSFPNNNNNKSTCYFTIFFNNVR